MEETAKARPSSAPSEGRALNTPETISNLRTLLAERRMVRQRSKQLETELASYSTPAERLELEAIMSRHTAEEIAELEEMLSHAAIWRPISHL